jgi:hypothetical protein
LGDENQKDEISGTCSTCGEDPHKVCWWGNLRARGHLNDVGLDGRIILKEILMEICWGVWTGFIWLRLGTSDGLLLKRVTNFKCSIKCGDSLDSLRNCQLLKQDSVSCS